MNSPFLFVFFLFFFYLSSFCMILVHIFVQLTILLRYSSTSFWFYFFLPPSGGVGMVANAANKGWGA